ncbi:type II toxin-antitoxin system RelE/ParE family toxin [Aliirhizobium terrae]|uniref:type II toxin-antitoxin system RelE/ParE family toxin n=1 Tax=Terrirhizobium terrae TaxID=2926709 RepID=UPI0025774C7E|nr:type II toxin-antitoxin system RelE/ParE family toxin [Rhizobium sp. CC-CFT758]WJH39250.1 type II toxin-antitoxin system RelE/ParE family toxin [Rhizobium sp. CC-CFT758]
MTFRLRYAKKARADIKRLYAFLLEHDFDTAERAVEVIIRTINTLREFPFAARKAQEGNPFIRELVIPFESAGYVALFEIENATQVTILAIRHQREDDYH